MTNYQLTSIALRSVKVKHELTCKSYRSPVYIVIKREKGYL